MGIQLSNFSQLNLPHRKCDRKELDLYEEELVTGLPGFLDYQLLDLPGLLLTSRLLCIFRLLHVNLDLAVLRKELNQKWHKVKRTLKAFSCTTNSAYLLPGAKFNKDGRLLGSEAKVFCT